MVRDPFPISGDNRGYLRCVVVVFRYMARSAIVNIKGVIWPGERVLQCSGVFLAICLPLLSTSAHSAVIEVIFVPSTEYTLVTVTGPFELSDIDNFKTKISVISRAIVSFVSDGGSLLAGIEIGTTIRLKGFASAVPDGARCASACALAWLGGTTRFMGNGAQIGFHSSSLNHVRASR